MASLFKKGKKIDNTKTIQPSGWILIFDKGLIQLVSKVTIDKIWFFLEVFFCDKGYRAHRYCG